MLQIRITWLLFFVTVKTFHHFALLVIRFPKYFCSNEDRPKKLIIEKTFCHGNIYSIWHVTRYDILKRKHSQFTTVHIVKLQVYFYFVKTIPIEKSCCSFQFVRQFPSFSLSFVTITTNMSP